MARAKSDSKSQTARARARQAMSDQLEKARKREAQLVTVFSAIDARETAEVKLGEALIELKDLGVAQADLAEMTGLSTREVSAAVRSAKNALDDDGESNGGDTDSSADSTQEPDTDDHGAQSA